MTPNADSMLRIMRYSDRADWSPRELVYALVSATEVATRKARKELQAEGLLEQVPGTNNTGVRYRLVST